eukprot:m.155168 g.155168  ORF g.155168 m.155168 type:complete len:354 (-) comp17932_c0_seq1:300-1361(-)
MASATLEDGSPPVATDIVPVSQNEEDGNKVLIAKEGKFELLTPQQLQAAEDLPAGTSEINDAQETPAATSPTDVTGSAPKPVEHKHPTEATASKTQKTDARAVTSSRKPRAQSAKGDARKVTGANGNGQHGASQRQRPKSAAPHSPVRTNTAKVHHSPGFKLEPGHRMTAFSSEASRDSFEAWVNNKRKASAKAPKSSAAEQEARRLAAKKESEDAFEAWKAAKNAEHRRLKEQQKQQEEDARLKAKAAKDKKKEQEEVYNSWLQQKKQVTADVRKQQSIYIDYTAQIEAQKARQMQSDEAVRAWKQKKKESELREQARRKQRKQEMAREARALNRRMIERLTVSDPRGFPMN